MTYQIIEANEKEKDELYKLLQFALYDGSQYIDNDINEKCVFEYKWFDNYFLDNDRNAFFIKSDNNYIGMVLINENLKFIDRGKSIAEFFILPKYRRHHIGKKVAYDIFNKFDCKWEVQPMENNVIAYSFWKKVISEYTNDNYEVKNDGVEDIFIFDSKKIKVNFKL